MSPRCPHCPLVLLALLLMLVGSQGSQECQDQAVTIGGSLCLVLEEPWEWGNIHWKMKMHSGSQYKIVTASRDGDVSYPKGPFLGRAEFHPGNLSLCLSPINKADSGVYAAMFENSSGIFHRCFRVSVWDPIPEPSLQSQILEHDRGWCRLSLLCSSPGNGNISTSWECPEDLPDFMESPGSSGTRRFQWIPEDAEPQICLCNLSNPAGWRTAPAPLTCPGILRNSGLWVMLGVMLLMILVLVILTVCLSRKSRESVGEGEILGISGQLLDDLLASNPRPCSDDMPSPMSQIGADTPCSATQNPSGLTGTREPDDEFL